MICHLHYVLLLENIEEWNEENCVISSIFLHFKGFNTLHSLLESAESLMN
jgi:hypothetical protein